MSARECFLAARERSLGAMEHFLNDWDCFFFLLKRRYLLVPEPFPNCKEIFPRCHFMLELVWLGMIFHLALVNKNSLK